MVLSRIFALIIPIGAGALLGAIIGGILTGSDGYIIGWSIGGPFLVMLLIFLGVARSSLEKKKKATHQQKSPAGINETVTSNAKGSRGVVLNGEPVGGDPAVVIPPGMPEPSARPVHLRKSVAIVLVIAGAALSLIPAYTMIGWIASDAVHGQPVQRARHAHRAPSERRGRADRRGGRQHRRHAHQLLRGLRDRDGAHLAAQHDGGQLHVALRGRLPVRPRAASNPTSRSSCSTPPSSTSRSSRASSRSRSATPA